MTGDTAGVTNDGETMTLFDTPIATRSRPRARAAQALRYELNVLARDAADVVASIGGWLFDRRMAGWGVTVALLDHRDERALRILGVKVVEPDGVWPSTRHERIVTTVVEAELFDADSDMRSRVLTAMRRGDGEVAFWGSGAPGLFGGGVRATPYRLSVAAQAFKAHALAAVGDSITASGAEETLLLGGRSSGLLAEDMVPVC
ncbi:uncharacterized protein RMCB_2025 [Mycolicibacterium brisbanense]|uniref:Uncharacterized protein n=2 Tax=Mycolicibacterium brisbanense TaxID=146020 RepID=A0A100VXS6_9MYCO|nr:uncharacterized protein RMCB_2025 [Mycolicibacterium brisbanense]